MLVQFVADTLFKTLVAVPVVGGLVLVALVVGGNPFDLLRLDDLTQTISTMVGVLLAQPVALAAFAAALGIIIAGGSMMMFAVKAGTVTVLLAGDRAAGAIELPPLRMSALREANQTNLERFTTGVRALFFRYLRLGILLTVVYAIIGAAYIAFVFGPSLPQALDNPLTGDARVTVGAGRDHARQLPVSADADRDGGGELRRASRPFRTSRGCCGGDAKELGQVLAAILALMLMATGASILATTQLGLIGFVPFVGLAALAAAGLCVAGARRRLPVRRPHRRRDLPAHALRAAVGDGSKCTRRPTVFGRSRAHDAVEGRRALSGIRDPASRRAQRDGARPDLVRGRLSGAGRVSVGRPAVDHGADPRAPRRQHAPVRRDARLSAL